LSIFNRKQTLFSIRGCAAPLRGAAQPRLFFFF
jgi:hypothetical protein